jgi:cyclin B
MMDEEILIIRTDEDYYNYINKVQVPKEYIYDILHSLQEEEKMNKVNPNYMKHQKDINDRMRAILIDWITEVHRKFSLQEETLFITINIIDRFLSKKIIPRSELQLLGLSSLLIACKYEEIYIPELKDFKIICDSAYTTKNIINYEYEILSTLDFIITIPSVYKFLELFSNIIVLVDKELYYSRYLIELYLLDTRMNKYNPSLIALSSIYISMKVFKRADYHKVYAFTNTGDTNYTIKECGKEILYLIENIDSSNFQAAKRKYSSDEYKGVAMIKIN